MKEKNQQEEITEEKYIKGFNHGYILKEHKPELIENILSTTTKNEYLQGMQDGKDTFEQKRTKSRLNDLHELEAKKEKNKDLDLER